MKKLEIGAKVRCYLEDDAGGHILRKGTVTYINRKHGWFLVAVKFDLGIIRQAYHIIEDSNYEQRAVLQKEGQPI